MASSASTAKNMQGRTEPSMSSFIQGKLQMLIAIMRKLQLLPLLPVVVMYPGTIVPRFHPNPRDTRVKDLGAANSVRSLTAGCESRAKDCKASRTSTSDRSCVESGPLEEGVARSASRQSFDSPLKPQSKQSLKFSNRGHGELLFLELCAGTAVLSKCARKHGFRTMPVDRSKVRSKGSEICVMDLADPVQLACLKELITTEASHCITCPFVLQKNDHPTVSKIREFCLTQRPLQRQTALKAAPSCCKKTNVSLLQ